MSALPLNVSFDPDGISAWQLVLGAEEAALKDESGPSLAKYKDNLIGVRVLGWFLKDFWDHRFERFGSIPYRRLLLETKSCFRVDNKVIGSPEETKAQYEKVYALGLMYRNHLIHVLRSATGPLPTPSRHASRPSFDKHRENMLLAMTMTPKTKKDAKALALHRDGYKCMITRSYDWNSTAEYPEILQPGRRRTFTECAHLFSESAQEAGKEEYGATALTVLKMFGLEDRANQLLGGQVNDAFNVLTLTAPLHKFFDSFTFWFEELKGEPDTYKLVATDPDFFQSEPNIPRHVTFKVDPALVQQCEANDIPVPDLPDPSLIAIRASCARVANLSGAAEQHDRLLRDRETIPVLASDGSTADLLNSLLNRSFTGMEVRG